MYHQQMIIRSIIIITDKRYSPERALNFNGLWIDGQLELERAEWSEQNRRMEQLLVSTVLEHSYVSGYCSW